MRTVRRPALPPMAAAAVVIALLAGVGEFASLQRWRLRDWWKAR